MNAHTPVFDFDNVALRELPADAEEGSRRRQMPDAYYARVQPVTAPQPQLVAYSAEVAQTLGFSDAYCRSPEFAEVLTGNKVLPGMDPHATCYGGHQFGNWAGQLGDGRAINLGDLLTPTGERLALQLKGAGPTPFSRTADGFAVLRSSVREFLCSEAMHHLGVPTTRALSLTLSGEQVVRDILYDGHPAPEPGAVVCRVAPTFIRFGHFEWFASVDNKPLLKQLADHVIRHHFAHLPNSSAPTAETYVLWFKAVCEATAEMIIGWQRVGFVHGVMNTDNMSILGLTIDYGPYGWLDNFDPDWTPNTTDAGQRRYRFGQQPAIAQWNLLRLANAIYALVGEAEPLQEALAEFEDAYLSGWAKMYRDKLGLQTANARDDAELFNDLEVLLADAETDMTLFYRGLGDLAHAASDADWWMSLSAALYVPEQAGESLQQKWVAWLGRYRARMQTEGELSAQAWAARRERMHAVNPKYVLRNYLAQLAIDAAEAGDFSKVEELLVVMRKPYDEQPEYHQLAAKRPDWARSRTGCSQLSCSS